MVAVKKQLAKAAKALALVPEEAPASEGEGKAQAVASASAIPEGLPKSGRAWKVKQTTRHSAMGRTGMMSHLSKTFEQKEEIRAKRASIKELEKELKDQKRNAIVEAKNKREEQQKRRMANEYKTAVTQSLNPEKLKGMSKKQLRAVRKTVMNRHTGEIELVPAFGAATPKFKLGKGAKIKKGGR